MDRGVSSWKGSCDGLFDEITWEVMGRIDGGKADSRIWDALGQKSGILACVS